MAALGRVRDAALVALSLAGVVLGVRLLPAKPAPAASAAEATTSAAVASAIPPGREREASVPASLRLVDRDCDFEDKGVGDYVRDKAESGAVVLTREAAVAPDGSYDLVLHFHGGLAMNRILAPLGKPVVLASIDRGDSSGDYKGLFANAAAFDALLGSIDGAVGKTVGRQAKASRVLVSSFSAGYQAVREILVASPNHPAVRGVLLLDSLYGSFRPGSHTVDPDQLAPFEAAARRALEQPHYAFLLTHSDVKTDGYANTAEVATTLLDRLVVRSSLVKTAQERGMTRVAEERGFIVRGYGGSDKGAHCAHLALLPELVETWRSKL
ncbi:MAG: hypothetical protein HOW73_44440 [Polyangiaceae bacterium]|nr:hypothetical protein [Polyangiaceae bacterium]